jgi:hypothetical protein
MGYAIVAMLRMPSQVSVQPIPHVNQFFDNYDFERFRLRLVDSRKIDQNHMRVALRQEGVGPTYRRSHATPDPSLEDRAVSRHTETVRREREQGDVALQEYAGFRVIDPTVHDAAFPNRVGWAARREPSPGARCGTRSSYPIDPGSTCNRNKGERRWCCNGHTCSS